MRIPAVLICLVLSACFEEARVAPPPIAMTETALGHYCQMEVIEHAGPKGQIHLADLSMPIWFSQVRDAVAYIKSKERSADILAFYVNDMGVAADWENPGEDNWVDAQEAVFVVGSDAIGGMGAPELVPFASDAEARAFAQQRGGQIKRLSEIEAQEVLAPVEISLLPEPVE